MHQTSAWHSVRGTLVVGCGMALALASSAASANEQAAKKVAIAYLEAASGQGDESGKELLLGGATMTAQLFSLENWRIVSKEPVRKEEGDLSVAVGRMRELDQAGRSAISKLSGKKADADGLEMLELSQAEAVKLLGPTRQKADLFTQKHPVLSYATRVGKDVYWHPKNPMRAVLGRSGGKGRYTIELHLWQIETREGPRQVPRVWPLRVLRFTAGGLDTGWKVLPASDWNAE